MGPARLSFACAVAVFATACTSEPVPTAPDVPPGLLISDALHGGGNEHFYWLPPLVADPGTFAADFDDTVLEDLLVRIRDHADNPVAEFTMTTGPGSERVRLAAEDEQYLVNWHTRDFDVGPGTTFRISVLVAGTELGLIDVEFGASGAAAENLTTGETIGLKDGQTLPIKFRVEEGAVYVVSPAEGGTVTALGGAVKLEVPPGAVDGNVGITVKTAPPTGTALATVVFGPEGTTFAVPVPVTIGYDEAALGGLSEDALGLNLLVDGRWVLMPGSTVDPATNSVTAPFHHFSTGGAGPAALAIFCSGDTDPTTFEALDQALDGLMPDGTAEVCDGTHVVNSVRVDQPVTITAAAGDSAVIRTTTDSASLFIDGVAAGLVTIRDLYFENASPRDLVTVPNKHTFSLQALGSYDQVVVSNVTFTATRPDASGGVFAGSSSVPGARLQVQNSRFSGGRNGAYGIGAPDFDISGSTFGEHVDVAVQYFNSSGRLESSTVGPACGDRGCLWVGSNGGPSSVTVFGNTFTENAGVGPSPFDVIQAYGTTTSVVIEDNDLVGCADGQCVRGTSGASLTVVGNRITTDAAHDTRNGILGSGAGTTLAVTDNVITGVGQNQFGFGLLFGAIASEHGAVVTADRNTLSNVTTGLNGWTNGIIMAHDNVVSEVGVGIRVWFGAQVHAQFNDVTNANVHLNVRNTNLASSDLTCNYYGGGSPRINASFTLPITVFAPLATAPIADTDHAGCDPAAGPTVTVAVGPDPADPLEYGSVGAALAALPPGGTILVKDGIYDVNSVRIDQPVTIASAVAATPVLRATTDSASLFIDGVLSGPVTIRDLTFENASPQDASYSLHVLGSYDQVLVDNVIFTATHPDATGGLFAGPSTVPGARVLVSNSTFSGGKIGATGSGAPDLDITGSTFGGHSVLAVQYHNSSGRLEASTLGPECGAYNCVFIGSNTSGASTVTVFGNNITEHLTAVDPFFHNVIEAWGPQTHAFFENNDIDGCGRGQCILAANGAYLEVLNNRITAYAAHDTRHGILGSDGTGGASPLLPPPTLLVNDNIITGGDASGSGFVYGAIQAEHFTSMTANRNTITKATTGIGGWVDGRIMARDNVVRDVGVGIRVWFGAEVDARFNDVTSAGVQINVWQIDPVLSDLTCNWWGGGEPSTVGPVDKLPDFAPWATTPVANTGATGC